MRSSPQRADRQIEAGRAVLPLVVAVGRKVFDHRIAADVTQNVLGRAVELGIATSASLEVEAPRIAHTGDHEASPDLLGPLVVAGEPDDGSDGPRHEEETV